MLLARHVMLFAFLCAFESFTAFQIRNDVSNSRDGVDVNNSSDGYDSNKLRELANAVISALRSLKEEKSGAEVKAAFQYIVQLAGVLLKGTQLGVHDVPETTTVINATVETGVNAAVKLNVELALLRQYARRLLKAVDERNEKDILISVITIQQRASLVIGIIDEAAIESISYQDPADEDQGFQDVSFAHRDCSLSQGQPIRSFVASHSTITCISVQDPANKNSLRLVSTHH